MIIIWSPPRGGTGREPPPPPQLASPVYANATSAMNTIIFKLSERVLTLQGSFASRSQKARTCQDAEVTVAMRDRASFSCAFSGSWMVTATLELPARIVTGIGSSI